MTDFVDAIVEAAYTRSMTEPIRPMPQPFSTCLPEAIQEGVEAEVIDPRTMFPLDTATILASIRKTGRLVVVDEARTTCSAANEIAAIAVKQAFYALKAPVKRVTVKDIAIPYSPPLEKVALPDGQSVIDAVREAMRDGS